MNSKNPRQIALKILNKFYQNEIFLEKILNDFLINNELSNVDKSLTTELVYGVVRWQIKIDFIISNFLKKDIQKLDKTILNILRLSIYQLNYLDKIPDYAIVNEAVNLTKFNKLNSFTNFVNAILRNYLRKKEQIKFPLAEDFINYFSIIYSHPQWLVSRLISQFGMEETEQILHSNNFRAKITIRVNETKSSISEVENFLIKNKIEFFKNEILPNCFVINKSLSNLSNSDFFKQGKFTIQDMSAALVSQLALPKFTDLKSTNLIFDLCAAPGGKTCNLAELIKLLNNRMNDNLQINNNWKIIANDLYSNKIDLIKNNVKRLGLNDIEHSNIEYSCVNALDFSYSEKADIVLLDAPCSGLGTISKKPDIKYLRKESDFAQLIELQRKLLVKSASLVKNGGILVYSTCTIDKEENVKNIEWFLQNNNEFSLEPADNYVNKMFCDNGFLKCFSHKNYFNSNFEEDKFHNFHNKNRFHNIDFHNSITNFHNDIINFHNDISNFHNIDEHNIDGAFAVRLVKNNI